MLFPPPLKNVVMPLKLCPWNLMAILLLGEVGTMFWGLGGICHLL